MQVLLCSGIILSAGMVLCACSSGCSIGPSSSRETQGAAEVHAGRADLGPSGVGPGGRRASSEHDDLRDDAVSDTLTRTTPGGPSGERCFLKTPGVFGTCMPATTCAALGAHVSAPGHCAGAAGIECCTPEPRVEGIIPPAGWAAVPQTRVTAEMTAWALRIVTSPTAFPMGSTTTEFFGPRQILARVEWHPPDAGHGVIHRGVTLYEQS